MVFLHFLASLNSNSYIVFLASFLHVCHDSYLHLFRVLVIFRFVTSSVLLILHFLKTVVITFKNDSGLPRLLSVLPPETLPTRGVFRFRSRVLFDLPELTEESFGTWLLSVILLQKNEISSSLYDMILQSGFQCYTPTPHFFHF